MGALRCRIDNMLSAANFPQAWTACHNQVHDLNGAADVKSFSAGY
jgi:hypothetical protein